MALPRPLLAVLLLTLPAGGAADPRPAGVRAMRVIRVPLRSMTVVSMPRPVTRWKESRGGKCIVRSQIAAAIVSDARSVDFILRDRTRHRALLQNSCPALDYYSGFYLKPTADGNICRDRDAVHDRSGSECQIDAFRKLTPAKMAPARPKPARTR